MNMLFIKEVFSPGVKPSSYKQVDLPLKLEDVPNIVEVQLIFLAIEE